MKSIFTVMMIFMVISGISMAQTTITIYSVADNTPDEYYPTTNRGNCDRVYLTGGTGTRERGLFKFDLSSIPAGATITSGTLNLYRILGTGSGTVNVHRVTSEWTEGIAPCSGTTNIASNWNQRTSSTNWTVAGGDYDATVEASAVSSVLSSTVTWNILSLIQGWYSGTYANNGLIIKLADESTYNQMTFATREYIGTANDARLVVIYTTAVPVELVSFNANVRNYVVYLDWTTATEVNSYGFEILRHTQSSTDWEKIGFVNGNGNSNSPKRYSFEDNNVLSGKYSYRLKQIDNDGQFEYSKEIEVDLGTPTTFELSQNYPNPCNPTTSIRFSLPEAANIKLTLYNILGQEIKTLLNQYKEVGVYSFDLNVSELNSGLYIYNLQALTAKGHSFVETRKMILLK
jgi:hypothetical protein